MNEKEKSWWYETPYVCKVRIDQESYKLLCLERKKQKKSMAEITSTLIKKAYKDIKNK